MQETNDRKCRGFCNRRNRVVGRSGLRRENAGSGCIGTGMSGEEVCTTERPEAGVGGRVTSVKWCVISRDEKTKCEDMSAAFKEKAILPKVECIRRYNTLDCMHTIFDGRADLINLDAGDAYVAGKQYGLIPILAEKYSSGTESYAVAVSKENNDDINIDTMENRTACFSGIKMGAGWVVPIATMFDWGVLQRDGCQYNNRDEFSNWTDTLSVDTLFEEGCVPGVLLGAYDTGGMNGQDLCDACANTLTCRRNHKELYYGNMGSLRCLIEGTGEIAFTNHLSALAVTFDIQSLSSTQSGISVGLKLLCKNGTRRAPSEYEDCHFNKVPSNIVMTSGNKTDRELHKYRKMLRIGQYFFGGDNNDNGFKMFDSSNYTSPDLMFSDATNKLVVKSSKTEYSDWLGQDHLRLQQSLTGCIPPKVLAQTSGTRSFKHSLMIIISILLVFYFNKNEQ
ncbi:otolith matrix protein 1-like [Saccoglossus kowalevskii]|uniref:Melanotransferrin-like n=1 Tax=Saccoglossus kowalevskii TaxID=10224 RepID=A0ABM0MC66_SACKO|nr:PREDICTED: melanotransferrin-like [Saccoglossus kowalevskii]